MTLTPKQFNKLATKEDLKIFATKEELKEMRGEILQSDDKLMKKLDIIEHAFVSNQAAHDRFEQHISKIEQHLGLTIMSTKQTH